MEYKIITGNAARCQKLLNQWKHEFDLSIVTMNTTILNVGLKEVTILLARSKKVI